MRYLVMIGLCLAWRPIAALGDDGDYLLRLTRHGYENTPPDSTKPVDKQLDAVDLTITPGIPFGVVTRSESRTIKFSGIVRRKRDSDLYVVNLRLSKGIAGPLTNTRDLETSVELPIGKPLDISALTVIETGDDGQKIETRTFWTLELTK